MDEYLPNVFCYSVQGKISQKSWSKGSSLKMTVSVLSWVRIWELDIGIIVNEPSNLSFLAYGWHLQALLYALYLWNFFG